ncbi:hypothetical protein [Streptomyces sp. NEAU-174]|uniref:hypothetical protein n=1 Tax=Streptomyces sp. NEAU-174 TaxID=3458254 RepID=UPI004044CF00
MTDTYIWKPATCYVCADPDSRLAPGDSDRPDILICNRCPAHGHPPYRDLLDVATALTPPQKLAMRADTLMVGTPAEPDGLTPYTLGVANLAESKRLRPTWRTGKVTHTLVLSSPGPHGVSGHITVGARSGKILRALLEYPTDSITAQANATGTNAVRELLAGVSPSQCPPNCDAPTVDTCLNRAPQ